MKSIIKKSSLLLLLATGITNFNAQVGIGVASPNTNSILDLTNTNGKGLLLPKLLAAPAAGAGTEGMLYYYSNNLFLRDGTGYNAITPWQYLYNGSTDKAAVFNPTGYKGVGIGLNASGVLGNLHIALTSKEVSKTGTSAALLIGDNTTGNHMLFDNDEIMVKSDAATGGLLKLQEDDGSLTIGSDRAEPTDALTAHLNTTIGSSTNNKNLTVHGNVDAKSKIKEAGNDLIPPGVIVMWGGTTPPAGWVLCDGGAYTTAAGAPAIAPNLKGRFIVGYSSTDTRYSTIGNNSGADSTALTNQNVPNHVHTGATTSTGTHSHTGNMAYTADNDDWDHDHTAVGHDATGTHGHGAATVRSTGSGHNHNIATTACTGCNAAKFDNRPPYYTLAYIIKK